MRARSRLAIGSGLTVLMGCIGGGTPDKADAGPQGRPSFDDNWLAWATDTGLGTARADTGVGRLPPENIALIGDLLPSPFVHDHQQPAKKCATRPCREYGPEARVLAHTALDDWTTERHFDTARDVATLSFWGNGDYSHFGLTGVTTGDAYTVVLHHTAAGWTGGLRKGTSAPLVPLRVSRTSFGGTLKPARAARFSRNVDGEVGIGVQCADGWCILSKDAWAPPTSRIPCDGLPETCSVPGWGDEQELSTVGAGGLQRDGVIGGVYPVPDLGQKLESHFTDTWVHVGYARTLRGVYRKGRIRIRDDAFVTIFLRREVTGTTERWLARLDIVDDSGSPQSVTIRNVKLEKHAVFPDVGTIRWGWDPNDEGLWVRCPTGCCKVPLL